MLCNLWIAPKQLLIFTSIVGMERLYRINISLFYLQYGDLCISGGRDRSLALWRVPAVASADIDEHNHSNAKPEKLHHDAHTGWVWDLAADCPDNARMIYSASWDNTVKAWDLETEFTHTQDFK